jgi:hypothetical protein
LGLSSLEGAVGCHRANHSLEKLNGVDLGADIDLHADVDVDVGIEIEIEIDVETDVDLE